jgi:hypothetical protein
MTDVSNLLEKIIDSIAIIIRVVRLIAGCIMRIFRIFSIYRWLHVEAFETSNYYSKIEHL